MSPRASLLAIVAAAAGALAATTVPVAAGPMRGCVASPAPSARAASLLLDEDDDGGPTSPTLAAFQPGATLAAVQTVSTPAPAKIAFAATTTFSPKAPAIGSLVTIQAVVADKGAPIANTIVQIDIYGSAGKKVFHRDLHQQAFASGQIVAYTCTWRPLASGTYTVTIGIFSPDWRRLYYWNDAASVIKVR